MEALPTKAPTSKDLVAAALVAAALGWAYAPNLSYLEWIWSSDPNFSHGYFVVPIALAILWIRRDGLRDIRARPRWWGLILLAGVLGIRSLFYEWNEPWLEDATIPPAVACLALAFGGWPLLRWALPAIVMLGFMMPLPNRVNTILAYPLQRLATIGSCELLQGLGLPVLAEGNTIIVGPKELEVARACNGLSMLLSFLTLITAAAILVRRPLLDRAILLASAIPIALVSNVLRISITAWCFHHFGTDELDLGGGIQLPHDWAGYLMMPIALVMVWLELKVLSWLVVEPGDPGEDEAFALMPGASPSGGPQAAPAGGAGWPRP